MGEGGPWERRGLRACRGPEVTCCGPHAPSAAMWGVGEVGREAGPAGRVRSAPTVPSESRAPVSPREALSPVSLPGVYAIAFSLVRCLVLGAAWATVWGPVKPGSGWGALGYGDAGVPHVAMARGLGLPGEAGPLPDTCGPPCRWLGGGDRQVPAATATPKGPRASSPSRRLYPGSAHSDVKLPAERQRTYFI